MYTLLVFGSSGAGALGERRAPPRRRGPPPFVPYRDLARHERRRPGSGDGRGWAARIAYLPLVI